MNVVAIILARGGSKGVPKKVSLWWLILFKILKADFCLTGAFFIIAKPYSCKSFNHLCK